MFGNFQKTIKESVQLEGVGLHTGELVNMKINPAGPNTGIVFKRIDLENNNYVVPGIFNLLP